MCHPAWRRAHAPAPFPRELVRVRRVRDRLDRDAATRAQAAHDGAPRLPLDLAALAACSGLPEAQLAGEFTRAYGVSPEAYLSTCEGGTAAGVELPLGVLLREHIRVVGGLRVSSG